MTLNHGERHGTLTVLGEVRTKNGLKYRVGCVCGFSKQLVRASRFNRGIEKCVRGCANGNLKCEPLPKSRRELCKT